METSDTIGKLAEALCKAQSIMEHASKDSDNPFFKSKYADLAAIWDVCRKPLTDNGISVVQSPVFLSEHPEMVGLDTRLCHSSGEWMEGRIVMKPVKSDPQSYGSCLTYLRRYSLQSFISICAELDDDGNAASQGAPKAMPIPPKPVVVNATDKQITAIHAGYNAIGIKERANILESISIVTGKTVGSSKELTVEDAGKVLDWIAKQEKAA